MFISRKTIRAFTLVEVLITLTIFSLVAVVTVNLLVNGLRSARRIQAQVYLYSEAQALMDQIARDVQSKTVDYEAYYSRNVAGDTSWDTPTYGNYAKSFFDPGDGGYLPGPYSPTGDIYGATCADGSEYPADCSYPVSSEQDNDTGAHPYSGIDSDYPIDYSTDDPTTMNAFCEGDTSCDDAGIPFTDELILVNGAGDERSIYSRKLLDSSTTEYGLAHLLMLGTDSNNDGLEDTWDCSPDYPCAGAPTIDEFISISPSNISVLSFNVLIAPSEDPYRAAGEADTQLQPQVTIIMEIGLSDDYGSGLIGDLPSILIQRTISTGVYSKVVSYE